VRRATATDGEGLLMAQIGLLHIIIFAIACAFLIAEVQTREAGESAAKVSTAFLLTVSIFATLDYGLFKWLC
jgi:hypothetical protein